MSETHLQRRIVSALQGLPQCDALRVRLMGRGGFPDILACIAGSMVLLEVKMPGKESTLTELQRRELQRWNAAGATTACVTSVAEALLVALAARDSASSPVDDTATTA